jgi:hypothetical protein
MCSAMPYVNGKCYLPRIIQKISEASIGRASSAVRITLPIAFDYALLMCFLGWFFAYT